MLSLKTVNFTPQHTLHSCASGVYFGAT